MNLLALLKKELKYQIRTYRLLVLVVICLVIGIGSPITAKVMPDIISSLGTGASGIQIVMTIEPSATDGLVQYHKNFGLIPLLLIFMTMGAMAEERSRGTAAMILTKPVSRFDFLAAKFLTPALSLALALSLAAVACYYYLSVLFPEATVDPVWFAGLNVLLLTWLLAYLAVTLLASVIFKGQAAAGGAGVLFFALMLILGSLPRVGAHTVQGLYVQGARLINGTANGDLWKGYGVSLGVIIASLVTAWAIFRRQEL
ncbi:MAG: ABC transporter permease subunit [Chloroflexota bacterium]